MNCTRRKGNATAISTAATATATTIGRRITQLASRDQKADPSPWIQARRIDRAFTRGPRTASSAGRTVSDHATAMKATRAPPRAMLRIHKLEKKKSPSMLTATAMPENVTALPAVVTVRMIAAVDCRPLPSSSL